jgi:glycine hydroxymethyltransferase
MTNKYAEGYPGRRYYGGCEAVDIAEVLAIERACQLFGCGFANVQPHSGSQANQAVFLALLQPGDTFMGLDLAAGGHLTHGSPGQPVGQVVQAGALHGAARGPADRHGRGPAHRAALEARSSSSPAAPPMPAHLGLRRFRAIADEVGAYLHGGHGAFRRAGRGGAHPSPFPHAHVVTTTTHKTLRGPRGGMILTNDEEIAKKFNSAVFPGLQGGPLMHVIAAKAVAFGEALRPEFRAYAAQVVANAQALAEELRGRASTS